MTHTSKNHIGWTIHFPDLWMREPESYPHFTFEQTYNKMMQGSEQHKIIENKRTEQDNGSVLVEITVDMTIPGEAPFIFTYGFLFCPIFKN
jgi:hypothetical protein